MSTKAKVTQDAPVKVFTMGGERCRIRTQVAVERVTGSETSPTNEVRQREDGTFEVLLSDADAISIYKSERAMLETAFSAIRNALFQHLSAISKSPRRGRQRRGFRLDPGVLASEP